MAFCIVLLHLVGCGYAQYSLSFIGDDDCSRVVSFYIECIWRCWPPWLC